MVNSVFSSMANFNSSINPNNNNSLMNHIRSWQRSRRLRSFNKNSVVNPMNNLCYQSMLPKSSTDISSVSEYKSNPIDLVKLPNDPSPAPVVSFLNKGEGIIAMQLVNRVMVNENQLYSMQLNRTKESTFKSPSSCQLHKTFSDISCYETLELPQDNLISKTDPLRNELWYYGPITREKAIEIVHNCATGSFVVRNSSTKQNCFALTVKVPHDYNHTGVAHYLIIHTEDNRYKIKVRESLSIIHLFRIVIFFCRVFTKNFIQSYH